MQNHCAKPKIGHTKLCERTKERKFPAQRWWSTITAIQQLQQHQLSFEPNKCIARGIKYESNICIEVAVDRRKGKCRRLREAERWREREEVYNEKSINMRFFSSSFTSQSNGTGPVVVVVVVGAVIYVVRGVFRSESFHLIWWYVQRSLNEDRFVERNKSRQQQHQQQQQQHRIQNKEIKTYKIKCIFFFFFECLRSHRRAWNERRRRNIFFTSDERAMAQEFIDRQAKKKKKSLQIYSLCDRNIIKTIPPRMLSSAWRTKCDAATKWNGFSIFAAKVFFFLCAS